MTDKQLALLTEVAAALASVCQNEGRHSRAQSLRDRITEASDETGIPVPHTTETQFRANARRR